jgi:unsaturated rhamnogalacturonyl hydrolase
MPDTMLETVADAVVFSRHPSEWSTNWGESLLMYGLAAAANRFPHERYLAYIRAWMEHHLRQGVRVTHYCGTWGPVLVIPTLFRMYGDDRYLALGERICEFIMHEAIRWPDGAIQHSDRHAWLFVDTVYYCAPELVRMGALLDRPAYFDEAVRQVELHTAHLFDPAAALYLHAEEAGTGRRTSGFWGRGNGWMAMSCIELLEWLPKSHPGRPRITALFQQHCRALLGVQDTRGLWHTVLERPDTYLETSCSAMFAYCFARGLALGLLERAYMDAARRTWRALQDKVDERGNVVGVSAGTGPGDVAHYNSIPTGTYPWGTGAFLLAATQME